MMTPEKISHCRHRVQYEVTAAGRSGHKPHPLITGCLPEALDEIERLRDGLVEVYRLLGGHDFDARTFSGDVLAVVTSHARAMAAQKIPAPIAVPMMAATS